GVPKPDRDFHDRQLAASPYRGGAAVLAEGLDAQHLGAPVAAPHPRRERRARRLAPSPNARGDMSAICREHRVRAAASGELAVADPPDLVREAAEQVVFMRDEQNGAAAAPQPVDLEDRALTQERVVPREGVLDTENRAQTESQPIRGAEIARAAGLLDHALVRRVQSGGETQQPALARPVLADDADDRSVRRGGVEITEGRGGHAAECQGHK